MILVSDSSRLILLLYISHTPTDKLEVVAAPIIVGEK